MFTIDAKVRDPKASLPFLRKEGLIPAVFYGMGKTTTPVSISARDFLKIWKQAGESSTVTLKTDKGTIETLIHDVAVDPITGNPIHADFLAIDVNKEIEVKVPIEFTGIAPAVKNGLGTLVKVLHELEIKALPKDMPHTIAVSIESLENLESQISVDNIVLPSGVSLVTKGHEIVAAIAAMKEEKEEETLPPDLSAIEVEKKGKKEEEGEQAPTEAVKE